MNNNDIALPSDRATHEQSPSVSAVPVGIPSAIEALLSSISARKVEINDAIDQLRSEFGELDRIERGLRGSPNSGRAKMRYPTGKTIASCVMEILEAGPMTGRDISARMPEVYGRHIQRESIAPHMSRLKHSGFLDHKGQMWALTTQAIEARRAETGTGSVHESSHD